MQLKICEMNITMIFKKIPKITQFHLVRFLELCYKIGEGKKCHTPYHNFKKGKLQPLWSDRLRCNELGNITYMQEVCSFIMVTRICNPFKVARVINIKLGFMD